MATAPVFTDTVNQQFFIEAQTGPRQPTSYLDRFPDTLYTKGVDSVLVMFLYTLLGPAGSGYLREQYLAARLAFEDAGLGTADLDALYTSPFALARLAEETYTFDAGASLLSSAQRAEILSSDASFRNRAIDFLKGVRAGGTKQGFGLVAKSGLNRPVEVFENYRALYDQFSDRPLNLPFMGTTTNLDEVIIQPRQEVPQSSLQTLVLTGEPVSGWLTLTLGGPNYQTIQVTTANGSPVITVPDSSKTPVGVYVTIAAAPFVYAEVGSIISATQISLIYPPTSPNAGQAYKMTTSQTYTAYTGYGETLPIPYNAGSGTVQSALQALMVVGGNNVQVRGGPLPDQPVTITFTNQLSDQPIPQIQANLAPTSPIINGIGTAAAPQMVDVTGSNLSVGATVLSQVVGASADSQTTTISSADDHAMQVALDQIRPQTVFVTSQMGQGVTQRLTPTAIFAGSAATDVLQYETGNAGVVWPNRDALHWLENGQEHEALRTLGHTSQYLKFHNISSVMAYTEQALTDPHYGTPDPNNPLWTTYWDIKIGSFSPAQQALYPFLAQQNNQDAQYSATQAVDPQPELLVITGTVNGTGIINNTYAVDYMSLPGVPQISTGSSFWASLERVPDATGDPSVDYLEVDLGAPQAVNYIYFEATNKPYTISVTYDTLDQSPSRRFMPISLAPPVIGQSTTSLIYNATATNPWSVVEIHCLNTLGQMLYTRYLRIGFQRVPGNSPFAPPISPPIPYSIEVRNLRVGRNLSHNLIARTLPAPISAPVTGSLIYPDLGQYPSSNLFP